MIKKFYTLILLMSVTTLLSQTAELSYKLRKGDVYGTKISLKMNMQPIMNLDMALFMQTETIRTSKNEIENKSQVKEVFMDMSSQGEKVSFDSTKSSDQMSEQEKKMKGEMEQVMKMFMYQTMTRKGKVLSTKTVPDVKGKGSSFASQTQLANLQFPTEEVKIGSTWSTDQNMNNMDFKTIYKVTKISDNLVYADITGSSKMEGVKTNIDGKIEIERSSGMMTSMNLELTADAMGMNMGLKVSVSSEKIK